MVKQTTLFGEAESTIKPSKRYPSIPMYRIQLVRERSIPYEHEGDRRIINPAAACELVASFFQTQLPDRECFVVFHLNTKHLPISVEMVTQGTLDASLVHPREVFKMAILRGSAAVLLAHNHPSGDPSPSHEDRRVTDRLTDAGKLLGIDVLDHVVYGDHTGRTYSIRESMEHLR